MTDFSTAVELAINRRRFKALTFRNRFLLEDKGYWRKHCLADSIPSRKLRQVESQD
jgi:hypothetical protein